MIYVVYTGNLIRRMIEKRNMQETLGENHISTNKNQLYIYQNCSSLYEACFCSKKLVIIALMKKPLQISFNIC
jgi:hypothetical protein